MLRGVVPLQVDILTLFPEMFPAFLSAGIVGRARNQGIIEVRCTSIRDFATDRHRSVDDRPFGGGSGMVMMCGPVYDAVESVTPPAKEPPVLVLLTPQGEVFKQSVAVELSQAHHLILVCGRYEGFDERIREGLRPREVSIGDYVLTGGEVPAMVLIDAVTRLLPGALGDEGSNVDESFSHGELEYPHYTRPREFRGMAVPEVLLSGDHAAIEKWRREQARKRTESRRPDLLGEAGKMGQGLEE